jgi:hypothetical protein
MINKTLLQKYIIFLLLLNFLNCQETKDAKDEKKPNIRWTTETLIKYTLKNHGKDNYFICDPLNYISSEEKEVIYYRLEDMYNKLNITTVFFVLDKIDLEGLNITNELDKDEFDEEDDEFINKKNSTLELDNSTNITNKTLVKTEEERELEFKSYIAEVRKKLFNRKIFAQKESKCIIGIYTVDDLGKYLYVGKDYRDMVNKEEIKYLLEGKEYLIGQKNLYFAVDNLFSNFLYRYSPSKLDKFNKFMGFMGEVLGIGAIIFSYYLMNKKKEDQSNTIQRNQNNNKKEEKTEEKKEDKKDDSKKEESINNEKPKKD